MTLGGVWISARKFGAGAFSGEHPSDTCSRGITLVFPGGDFGHELLTIADPPVETLAAQYADLDLDHIEPASVFGDVVKLQPAHHPTGFRRREGLVERAGVMG